MVRVPKPNREDEVASSILTQREATAILDYLDKHEYATLRHIIVTVLWKTGMRRREEYIIVRADLTGPPNLS